MPSDRKSVGRRPRACAECSRRKIRCGPGRPCHPCLQRGLGSRCNAPLNLENASVASIDSNYDPWSATQASFTEPLGTDVAALRERIAQLEEQLATVQNASKAAPSSGINPDTLGTKYDIEELDYSMENLNLGLASNEHNTHDDIPIDYEPKLWVNQLSFPSRSTSTAVVRFSLEQLGWLHCALIAEEFMEEHERFWDILYGHRPQTFSSAAFTTTYFAILSVGLYYIDPKHQAIRSFTFRDSCDPQMPVPDSDEDLAKLSRYWYWAAIQGLEDSDFLGKPRLSSIQVIAILTLVNSTFGQNKREWMLLGVAVNMARMINMHRLGSELTVSPRIMDLPQWNTPKKRHLGRRLWWTLVICDWMGVMSHRPTIPSHSFDTILDLDSAPDDLISIAIPVGSTLSRPPSSLHYHELMAKLAGVVRTYVKGGRSYSPGNLIIAMSEVEKLDKESPHHLKHTDQSDDEKAQDLEYPWIPLQRYLAIHAVHFVRLTIARFFFTRWLKRQPDPEGLHLKACQASEIIVQAKTGPTPAIYRRSWIVCSSTVAAGVFLCLDMLFFSTGEDSNQIRRRRDSVQICINALREMGSTNLVAKRGSVVLEKLLEIQSTWSHMTVPDHGSLRDVLKQVIQAQMLEPVQETKWSRPSSLHRDVIFREPFQHSPMETGVSLQVSNITTASQSHEIPFGHPLDLFGSIPAIPNSEYAWDYLMSNGSASNQPDVDEMELEELEGFDNPFSINEDL